jgi:hypothetical protein
MSCSWKPPGKTRNLVLPVYIETISKFDFVQFKKEERRKEQKGDLV